MTDYSFPEPTTLRITFPDDLLNTNVEVLQPEIEAILQKPEVQSSAWNRLEIDLTSAGMVDSRGLNLLVSLIKTATEKNATVTTHIKSPNIEKTFRFLKLDKRMTIING